MRAAMDIERIRSQFPALQRTHNGLPVAYFDAPGGTQVPSSVAAAMTDYLLHHNANTHWAYPTSEETDSIIAASRAAAAGFLNADPSEVAFGANMTSLTFHLARTLARTWQPGDEVIVTDLDHHANVAPWRALEVDRGIAVRSARMVRETATVDYAHLAALVSKKTKLIAIGGASNAVGTINDRARVREIARGAGALMFVDAVHLAPHAAIDVKAIGCDFLAVSAYKFYGPHIGILFARSALMESLPFPKLDPAPNEGPERSETGTQNHEGIAGVKACVDFMRSIGHHEPDFTSRLRDGLKAIPRVRVYGAEPCTATVAFTVDGMTAEEVTRRLAEKALFVSHGDFYAATVIRELGVEALVRVGCACYTTREEVERLIETTAQICAGR
jgi:cysteine desulfurase family protein (TIGR01976 family)